MLPAGNRQTQTHTQIGTEETDRGRERERKKWAWLGAVRKAARRKSVYYYKY